MEHTMPLSEQIAAMRAVLHTLETLQAYTPRTDPFAASDAHALREQQKHDDKTRS